MENHVNLIILIIISVIIVGVYSYSAYTFNKDYKKERNKLLKKAKEKAAISSKDINIILNESDNETLKQYLIGKL